MKTSSSSNDSASGEQTTSADLDSLISRWPATDTHKSVTGQSMWELDCPLHTRRACTLCVCNIHISGLNYLLKCCGLENEISYSSTDRKIRQQLLQWTRCPYGCRYQSILQYVMDLGAVGCGGGEGVGERMRVRWC